MGSVQQSRPWRERVSRPVSRVAEALSVTEKGAANTGPGRKKETRTVGGHKNQRFDIGKGIMLHMNARRALWEAIATVGIPSLFIWGALFYFVGKNARSDEWPFWIVFLALPLPLIYPVYKRYLRGERITCEVSPRRHFIAALLFAFVGLSYVVSATLNRRAKFDLIFDVGIGVCWVLIACDRVRRGVKAKNVAGQQ